LQSDRILDPDRWPCRRHGQSTGATWHAADPGCSIKGLPSIRFDIRLSRESAADKTSGRVGADPSAILKPAARTENGQPPVSAPAAG